MAHALSLNTEKCVVWDISTPPADDGEEYPSPVFYFQNSECYFVLIKRRINLFGGGCHNEYNLYMRSKNGQNLPQPFSVTSYIMHRNSALSCAIQTDKDDASTLLRIFSDSTIIDNGGVISLAGEKFKMAMIFHGQIGSTLHLQSEKENFRNVAVGTDPDSDSTLEILSRDFSKLLDEDLYQDVELHCEDDTFKAHKNVLSTRSKVFLAMLQSDMLEGQTARVNVKEMKSDVCKLLLHYMYSGKMPELTPETARGLYEAADRYNVGGLMKPCSKFLTLNLTLDNACEMLVLADSHSDQNFKEIVIEYILDKEIPLEDDLWKSFCTKQPLLAVEVLNRFYRSQKTKKVIDRL